MKIYTTFLLNLLILFFAVSPAFGDVSVTLRLDRREAVLSDSVQLQVRLSGARESDTPPSIKGLEAFHVTPGGSASRVEIINGRYNSGVDYTYYLQPRKKGMFSIGPATVTVDGQQVKSNVVSLKVVPSVQAGANGKGPIFLTAALGKKTTYVEEEVPYTLKLYLRVNVSDVSLDLPESDVLTFRQMEKPSEYQGVYGGQNYRILEVRYGVTPLKAGSFHIPSVRMHLTVYESRDRSRRGLFNDPFFGGAFRSGRPLTLTSKSLPLEVKPFPEKGKPADFSGLVGRFDIKETLSETEIHVGDSATLTVRLTGKGNVSRLPDLKMPDVSDLKVYADDPVFQTQAGADKLTGSKTMKWALVPEKEGTYTIPGFKLSYFDPETGKYRTIETTPVILNALPGTKETLVTAKAPEKDLSQNSKQEVKEIGHDILPIYASTSGLKTARAMGPGDLLSWILMLAPFVIYLGVLLILRFQKRSDQALYAQRARKAARVFFNECRKNEKDANAMLTAIRDYINDRFQLSLGYLTPVELPEILVKRGVAPHTAAKLGKILEELESRIYTGEKASCGSMHPEILATIKQMEKELR